MCRARLDSSGRSAVFHPVRNTPRHFRRRTVSCLTFARCRSTGCCGACPRAATPAPARASASTRIRLSMTSPLSSRNGRKGVRPLFGGGHCARGTRARRARACRRRLGQRSVVGVGRGRRDERAGRARYGGVRHSRRRPACRPRAVRQGRAHREEFPCLQNPQHRRRAAAPRIQDRPRAQRLSCRRRSVDDDRGSREAERLHRQRHLMGSVDGRILRPVQRTPRPRQQDSQSGRSRDVRRRQSPRASRDSVCRAIRADARRPTRKRCADRSASTTCRPNGSGARSKNCFSGPSARPLVLRSRWNSAWSISSFQS